MVLKATTDLWAVFEGMAEYVTHPVWPGEKVVSQSEVIFCEPCTEDGKQLAAGGYCVDCDEYLCDICFSHHRTPRPFRNHVLQTKDDMPKKRSRRQSKCPSGSKCCIHPDKDIVSYCKSHDQLCCESCVLIGHRVCNDVNSIIEAGTGIENNPEFKSFYDKLQGMDKEFKSNQKMAQSRLETIDKYYNDAMERFRKRIDSLKAKDVAKISYISNAYDTAAKQLSAWINEIEKCWKTHQCGQLFVLMKMTHRQLDVIENNIQQLCNDNAVFKYRFVDCQTSRGNVLGKLEAF